MTDLTAVELFAGIGATTLALDDLGVSTVAHSEVDAYAGAVYAKRFPTSVALGDVTEITDVPRCDVMAGGFPCQDISNAGAQAGIGGSRSGKWSEFARLIGLARPRVVLIENVSALINRGLDVVLADLCALGYACEWDCIPAAAVGAPHLRDRVWITAYPEDEGAVRHDPLERALGTLALPPSKWPRAGRMECGAVYLRTPLAPRKTKRLNPGSAWVGVRLKSAHGWWHERPLWPTTQASMADRGGRGDLLQAVRGNPSPSGHFSMPMWPTPTRSDGAGGPGSSGRSGGPNLRSAVAMVPTPPTARDWKDTGTNPRTYETARAKSRLAGSSNGPLNPPWVEWLMGFPLGFTDLDCASPAWHGWNHEPRDIPRMAEGVKKRKGRLTCLGNGQVPQVMRWWAEPAIERLRLDRDGTDA